MTIATYLFIIVFLIGLYFYAKCSDPEYREGLTNNTGGQQRCPNLLIQKDSSFYLYNSKLAKVPGVNPIEFENLEDYTEFLDWQRSQGIRCPVLYLQETFDAQGNSVFKMRPHALDLHGGLNPSLSHHFRHPNPTLLVDASRNNPPFNKNSVPAYDETDYYVGTTTPLDIMDEHQENMLYSPNAMDPNWAGAQYTQDLVDNGYYVEREVMTTF